MDEFTTFSTSHLLAIALIAFASLAIPLLVRRLGPPAVANATAVAIGLVLLLRDLIGIPMAILVYDQPALQSLPLHLCGVTLFLVAYVLIRHSYPVFEVAYFWGLAGGMQAVLTPNLRFDFPHPLFISFFLAHGLIIVGVVYAMVVFRFRPTWHSLIKTVGVTLGYMLLIIPINLLLGTNFLYLREKPVQPSLIDYLGPWPWYVLGMIGVAVLALLIYYAPFAVYDRLKSMRSDALGTRH
jgi:hypothetical integral membrane protein (TIGR02206 family)